MKLYHVVATAKNNTIGLNDSIPWQSRADMSFFRRRTMNSIIVMGRKTYESLYRKRKGRHIVILTRNPDTFYLDNENLMGDTVVVSNDLQLGMGKILDCLIDHPEVDRERAYIVGGEQIYTLTANLVAGAYVSHIEVHVEGDAHYKLPEHLTVATNHPTELGNEEDPFRSYTFYETEIAG
ncbi:dihydrofolate reductase [Proteus mirabilis]